MNSTILQNPYTAILSAIWSAFWGIMKISQGTGNTLADRLHLILSNPKNRHYEYTTDGGAGNPLGLLHLECKDGGVV